MERWTNGRWVSSLHRVIILYTGDQRSGPRMSLALFQQSDWDAVIKCIPSCQGQDVFYRNTLSTCSTSCATYACICVSRPLVALAQSWRLCQATMFSAEKRSMPSRSLQHKTCCASLPRLRMYAFQSKRSPLVRSIVEMVPCMSSLHTSI